MNAPVKITPSTATPGPTTGDIHSRMVSVMRELGAIGKDKKNEAQGFKYRGIDDVYNAINPILAKYGVYMSAAIISKTREERTNQKGTVLAFTCLRMRYQFRAEDGSSVETEAEGEGMDSGDKSSNKAMAVAHKYALLQTFCIPTQDLDDPDAHVHEVTGKTEQVKAPATVADQDVEDGVRNWTSLRRTEIDEASRIPELYQWKDLHEQALARLKSKHVSAYNSLMQYYQAKFDILSKKEGKEA